MGVLKLLVWFIFTVVIVSALVSLVSLNQEVMTVSIFHYTSPEFQKWVVLSASVLIGAAFSALFFITTLLVSETRNIRLRRANRLLERALQQTSPGTAARVVQQSGLTQAIEPSLEEDV